MAHSSHSMRPLARSPGPSGPSQPRAICAPPRRRRLTLAFVCLAVIVIVMDGSIVNVALPTLASELAGASNSRLQWVVDAYVLAFAALLLTAGSAADRFGRRRMLVGGLTLFAAVSVGAAMARDSGQLVMWRALMGVGAAMIFPSTLAILIDAFPEPSLRRSAIATWAGTSGLGVAIGPVVGGWLLEHFQWGSVFLVNVPIALLAGAGVLVTARESRDHDRLRLDLLGGSLAGLAVLALVWGLIEAPERGWTSAATLGAFAAAALLGGAFVAWERRASAPMLDPRFFAERRFSGGCIAIAAAFFGLFGFVFMVSQYFQFLQGYDALEAGLRTTPFAAFILAGALLAVHAARRAGERPTIATGLLLMATAFAWAAGDTLATGYGTMVAQMGVLGIGLGLVNATATESIMGSLPPDRAGTGSSVNDTLREVGGTLGVAGMGSAFNAIYRADVAGALAHAPLPDDARSAIQSSVGAASMVIDRVAEMVGAGPAAALRAPIQEAFLAGFAASCWIACAAAAIGAGLVLLPTSRRTPAEGAGDLRSAARSAASPPDPRATSPAWTHPSTSSP